MKHFLILVFVSIMFTSCSNVIMDEYPPLLYDEAGVTVPVNIAPFRFALADSIDADIRSVTYSINGQKQASGLKLPIRIWKKLLHKAQGSYMEVTIVAELGHRCVQYKPFRIYISEDEVDPYIAYRLIEPGYELWNEMGIYQRNLESYSQKPIIENKMTDYGCVNCHSFHLFDPDTFMFHARMACGGTYFIHGDEIEVLDTKTPETMSALVYPQWHPSGKFVVFSVNNTKQRFHTCDRNRIEVFDCASDIVVYDVEKHELFSCPSLKDSAKFETFPTFSPMGDKIYFCCADSLSMPQNFDKIRYSLCSIDFNPENCSFGEDVRVLYDASDIGAGSVSFPRVSPDGKYLMYTLSEYGNFSIWHTDADLYIYDLQSGEQRCLKELNSHDVESYHSWSSNSKWVVFSSRRDDGLYTKLYLAHIDDHGTFSKPFLLPQSDPYFYQGFMKSYNIPEFISGPVSLHSRKISSAGRKDDRIKISFSSKNTL